MSKISSFAVDNPVLANLLMIGIIVIGVFWALPGMPREFFPNMSLNWGFIFVSYPGVSPEEIEQYIAIPLEEEIEDVDNIESITTTCSEGIGQISVKFETMPDDEFERCFQDLESKVNAFRDLPEDAEDPIVLDFGTEEFQPMVNVVLSGDVPEVQLKEVTEDLRDRIEDISGISRANIYGMREREIWVQVSASKLEFYGLALGHIVTALTSQNVSVPGGRIDVGREEFLLRTVGQFESVEDMNNVIIASSPSGGFVRLSDVAKVSDTFEKRTTTSRFDGQNSMTISTSKEPHGNTIALVQEVKDLAKRYEATLPPGVAISITGDTSVLIDEIITTLANNAYFGLVLVLVLLTLVMGWRNAIFAAIGIPVSFMLTFIFLWSYGESLNGNSLFGLVLILGVVVDDAIIIIENSYRYFQMGYRSHDAAKIGTAEVARPVISATLTTVAAFLPLMFVPGIIGKFMRIVPITVSLTLAASLFEAFVILPSHFAEWSGKLKPKRRRYNANFRKLRRAYLRVLVFTIRKRYLAIASIVVMLFVSGAFVFAVTGVELFREDEMDVMQIFIKAPPGTTIESTDEILRKVEETAWLLPDGEVESVVANAGILQTDTDWYQRTYVGQVLVNLINKKRRHYTGPELREIMDSLLRPVVAGAEDIEITTINTGPPVGAPIEFKVKGQYFEQLESLAEELKDSLATVPGVYSISDDFQPGKRELKVDVDIERAAMFGLDVISVARTVSGAFDGFPSGIFRDGDEEVDILVKYDEQSSEGLQDILNLRIMNDKSEFIALRDVATLETDQGVADVKRYNGDRAITISAEIDKSHGTIDVAIDKVVESFAAISPKYPGYKIDFGGEFKEFQTAFDNIVMLFMVGLILIYAILGTQFKSFAQPLIIMFTIPIAFIGAALGLFFSGYPLSIATMYGIVALAGIVVNDSLVLISFVNHRRASGALRYRAVMKAGLIRLRPIILTSVTTVFGLMPMVIGLGGKSSTWAPLANTIVWGLSVATLMTLFIIPALYIIVSDITRLIGFSRFKDDVGERSLRRKLLR